MKLTHRKISRDNQGKIIKATFYRDIYHGRLRLESDDTDRTDYVVKSMDFERSWRGRILKNAEKGNNPFLCFVEGLVNRKNEIVCEPVKTYIDDIDLLINKHISEFGKKLKAKDSPTLEELIRKMQLGVSPEELKPELEKIKNLIHKDIQEQINRLTKSIKQNSIPFEIKNDTLVPSTKKMKWLYQFLQSPIDEHMLDKYWDIYNYEELEKKIINSIKGLNNHITARSISHAVSKAVHEHHGNFRRNLSDTSNLNQSIVKQSLQKHDDNNSNQPNKEDFFLFLKAVEQHFKKYFPVKGKDSNAEHDNKLCDEKNYKFFYSFDFIKSEVYRSIINQLVAGLIQQGKLIHYFYDEPVWKTEYLNSYGLSYIQVEEAFKKSLMNALSWGIMRLTSFFYDGVVDNEIKDYDILLAHKYVSDKFNEIKSNDDIQNRFKEKLAAYFPLNIKGNSDKDDNIDNIDDIIGLAIETRESVAHLRHNIFHYKYKKTSFLDILRSIDKNIENNGHNKKYEMAPKFIKRDIEHIYDVFKEQIRSYGIVEYYPTWLIEECFKACSLEFTLYSPRNSLIPSFSKVYKKGANLYKSDKEHHKGLRWYIEVDNNNPGQVAYKNLIQLIYYHAFLPQVRENESLVTSFINSTKEWNKEAKIVVNRSKNKKSSKSENNDSESFEMYRYADIPDYNGETLDNYLKILQREQIAREKDVSEGKSEKNKYIIFIQDVVVRAFDSYLEKMIKYQNELQKPTKQERNIHEALDELLPEDKKNRKFIMSTRFNKYIEESKKDNVASSDGEHKAQNKNQHAKEQSDIKKEILCFYLFLRLLDAKELSKLQHQFIRYRCSLKERGTSDNSEENKILISLLEELEELMELVRYTIPVSLTLELAGKAESNYSTILKRHFEDFFEEGVLEKQEYQKLYYQSDNKTPIPLKHLSQLIYSAPLPLYRRIFKNYYLITEGDFKEYYSLCETIEGCQQKLNELHGILVKKKVQTVKNKTRTGKTIAFLDYKDANLVKEYEDNLKKVVRYKHLHSKLTFEALYLIFKIHVELLSRMIGYAQDWERDMFFLLLGLKHNKVIKEDANIEGIFDKGNIVKKIAWEDFLDSEAKKFLLKLCWNQVISNEVSDEEINKELDKKIWIRNKIAHLNHFTQSERSTMPSIEEMINALRILLHYDRKRQNSVTKTIKDLLLKEYHTTIKWKLSYRDLKLSICGIDNQPVIHLKNLHISKEHIIDKNAHLRNKQENWLRRGIIEKPYEDYLLRCMERLLIFPKEVRTSSEHKRGLRIYRAFKKLK